MSWYKDEINCAGETSCDLYFKTVIIQEEGGNEFLRVAETDVTLNTYNVHFSNVEQLNEAIPVDIHAGRDVTISFEVWNNSSADDAGYKGSMTGLVVPFSDITIGNEPSWKSFTITSAGNEATLRIKYRILSCDNHFTGSGCDSCEDNYYGTECSKYCKPVPDIYIRVGYQEKRFVKMRGE